MHRNKGSCAPLRHMHRLGRGGGGETERLSVELAEQSHVLNNVKVFHKNKLLIEPRLVKAIWL